MDMKRIGLILALAAGVTVGCGDRTETGAIGTTGSDATPAGGTAAARTDISDADRDFVNDMTIAGRAEVELGKLALEQAASADVKKFGQTMVDDHTAAGTKLSDVATRYAIQTPATLDEKHQDLYDKLSKLKGADFDREYMSAMVDGHQDVLSALESRIDKTSLGDWKAKMTDAMPGAQTPTAQPPIVTAETSDDPARMAINQWAADTYPVVYRHLQQAKTIDDAVNHRARTTQ
jgi:putative membrane protein